MSKDNKRVSTTNATAAIGTHKKDEQGIWDGESTAEGLDESKTNQPQIHYSYNKRHSKMKAMQVDYGAEDLNTKLQRHDENDILEIHPSYRKFHVPYEITTQHRYLKNKNKCEQQFRHEIKKLIDYQTTAIEASCFVRIVAYTTLWPPLHNVHEVDHTSNHFFQLTPKEKKRLNYIMSHEFR